MLLLLKSYRVCKGVASYVLWKFAEISETDTGDSDCRVHCISLAESRNARTCDSYLLVIVVPSAVLKFKIVKGRA